MNDNRISTLISLPISWIYWLYFHLLKMYGLYLVLCGPDSYDYLILVIYVQQFNKAYQFFSIGSVLLNYFSFIYLCINSTWSSRFFFFNFHLFLLRHAYSFWFIEWSIICVNTDFGLGIKILRYHSFPPKVSHSVIPFLWNCMLL